MTVRSAAQVVESMRGDPRTDPDAVTLSPDTQTRPTDTMREAIAQPTAGDTQTCADPTTLALEEWIADPREHQTALLPPNEPHADPTTLTLEQRIADPREHQTALLPPNEPHADPTTLTLEQRIADLLGHEAALLPPAGIMRDEIAVRSHVGRGRDEILAEASTHLINAEDTVVVPGGTPLLTSGPRTWSP